MFNWTKIKTLIDIWGFSICNLVFCTGLWMIVFSDGFLNKDWLTYLLFGITVLCFMLSTFTNICITNYKFKKIKNINLNNTQLY